MKIPMTPFASPPDTWADGDSDSAMHFLMVLGVIPLSIIALITLLVFLPSMMRRQSSEPAVVFADRAEWFGGPRKGVEADPGATAVQDDSQRGGASARW